MASFNEDNLKFSEVVNEDFDRIFSVKCSFHNECLGSGSLNEASTSNPKRGTSDTIENKCIHKHAKDSPYILMGNTEDKSLYNAVTVVGLILTSDHTNLSNQMSGFNTLCSVFYGEFLGSDTKALDYLPEYRVYPVVVNNLVELFQCVNFTDDETRKLLADAAGMEIPTLSNAVISTSMQYATKLQGIIPFKYETYFAVSMCGIVFLILFKKLTNLNYYSWIQKRWRAFTAAIGVYSVVDEEPPFPNYTTMPSQEACAALYTTFSHHFEFRRFIFEEIIKTEYFSSPIGKACHIIAKMTRFYEMSHIDLINTYIVEDNRSILEHAMLKDEVILWSDLLNEIQKAGIQSSDIPYLKILRKDEIIKKLDKKNFVKLTYIACKIGERLYKALGQYTCIPIENMEIKQELDAIVKHVVDNVFTDMPLFKNFRHC